MSERLVHPEPRPHKVAVVGTGKVGSTFAYALLLNGLVGQIVLIDVDRRRAEGEAMDLNHAVPLSHSVRIWAGDYPDTAGADVVVISVTTASTMCTSVYLPCLAVPGWSACCIST